MNLDKCNILICGIGGQGVVLTGKILSASAFDAGYDVKTSEVHGMAQRGGSVSTHLKYGEKIYSPLIASKSADILLSFDIYETIRYIDFANEKTIIITSTLGKTPAWTTPKIIKTPSIYSIINNIKSYFKNIFLIDVKTIAKEIENIKVANTILIGATSKFTSISTDIWLNNIIKNVPSKTIEINKKAFVIGRELIENKKSITHRL